VTERVLGERTGWWGLLGRRRRPGRAGAGRRQGARAFRPLVAGLEGRQLLTGYRFVTLAAFRPSQRVAAFGGDLVMDARGDLFGTTFNGGKNGLGSVFEVARGSRGIRTLASISSTTGRKPEPAIAVDARGDLFGVTEFGDASGNGTIFEVKKGSRAATPLASFGANSSGGKLLANNLVVDPQGNLFGTATPSGPGSAIVFELPKGSRAVVSLASLDFAPGDGLTMDAQGNLFFSGTAFGNLPSGPSNGVYEFVKGANTVIKVGTIGPAEQLGGGVPMGPVLDGRGNLFGATSGYGGLPSDGGLVFELANGAQSASTLVSFHGDNGANPTVPVVDDQGDLFGVTTYGGIGATNGQRGNGTVYEVAAGSNTVTTLFAFNGADGWAPLSLIADRRGDLFGVTGGGGQFNSGTVFELVKVISRRR
jgi:uncharacterized repeat protein (TIGR03803 family)